MWAKLAGAFYGASGIPAEWRNKIALGGLIESMAEELFDMSTRVDPPSPPLPQGPPPVSTPSTTPLAPTAAAAFDAAQRGHPLKDGVTRFVVKPAASSKKTEKTKETDDGSWQQGTGKAEDRLGVEGGRRGGGGGCKGRAAGAYWGVAAHYQRLEDGYT